MWKAELETERFSFMALGFTEQDALDNLQAGLIKHGSEYGLDEGWYYYCFPEWVNNQFVGECICLRDGAPLITDRREVKNGNGLRIKRGEDCHG